MRKFLAAAVAAVLSFGSVTAAHAGYFIKDNSHLDLAVYFNLSGADYVHEFDLTYTCQPDGTINFEGVGQHNQIALPTTEDIEYVNGVLDPIGTGAFHYDSYHDSAYSDGYWGGSGNVDEGSPTSGTLPFSTPNATSDVGPIWGAFYHVPVCETQDVTRDVTIPAPPAADFAGATGGDGLSAIPYNGRVYSVFHHQDSFKVACLLQSNGATCPAAGGHSWPVEFTTDNAGVLLGTPMLSYGFINPQGTKLYAYAMQFTEFHDKTDSWIANANGGVMCIELATAAKCGYTVLTNVGGVDTQIGAGYVGDGDIWRDWGSPARVGNRIYASFSDGPNGYVSCFDLESGSQCTDAPFTVATFGSESRQFEYLRGPRAVAYGHKIYATFHEYDYDDSYITCWDTETNAICGGVDALWPQFLNDTNSVWSVLPVLSSTGAITKICSVAVVDQSSIATTLQDCFDPVTGQSVADGFPAQPLQYDSAPAFYGQGRIVGTKVVFNAGTADNAPKVACVDFAASPSSSCNTPLSLSYMSISYSIEPDPQRPYCYWVNSDAGAGQIQNFDARTMTPGCGGNDVTITRSQIAPTVDGCDVQSWTSVKVTQPSAWTAATLTVTDPNGATLPNGGGISLTAGIAADLSAVDFTGVTDPEFVFSFTGANLASGVTAQFKYKTAQHARCNTTKPIAYAVPSPLSVEFGAAAGTPAVDFFANADHTVPLGVGPTATPDCSAPSYTTSTAVGLYAGAVTCVANTTGTNTDDYYFIDVETKAALTVTQATAAVSYTGTTGDVALGSSLSLASTVTPAGCTGTATYAISPEPKSGVTALPGSSASTTGWATGDYTITASYPGDSNCKSGTGTGSIKVKKTTATFAYTGTKDNVTVGAALTISSSLTPVRCTGSVFYSVAPDPALGSGSTSIAAGSSTADWPADTYTITATYAGDSDCASASDSASLIVGKKDSTVTYDGTTGNLSIGSSISLAATVTTSGCTGSVTYSISPDPKGSGTTLTGSSAATTGWLEGSYTITATYPGDAKCKSATATGGVVLAKKSATISYTGDKDSHNIGESLTLSASVLTASCTGSITYSLDRDPTPAGVTGTYSLTTSSVDTTGWVAGTYTLTATYEGSTDCNSATDTASWILSTPKPTASVSYTGSNGNKDLGTSLSLSAAVTPSQCAAAVSYTITPDPTGVGDHLDFTGTTPSTSGWAAGTYTITAKYLTDTDCNGATGTGSLTLAKATPTLTYSGSSGNHTLGETLTTSSSLNIGYCTGSKSYALDKNPTNGNTEVYPIGASIDTASWLPDTYTITSTYAGDSNCDGASDTGDTVIMGKASPTVTYTGTKGLVTVGSSITLSSSLSLSFCTGAATYSIAPDPLSSALSAPLTGPTVTTTGWATGVVYLITATYAGDSRCNGDADTTTGAITVTTGGDPGNGTYGGGWYKTGSVRVSFGHVITSTTTTDKRTGYTTTVYKGQVLWMSRNGWRLKGSINSSLVKNGSTVISGSAAWVKTSCPSNPTVGSTGSKPVCGRFSGTAVLQRWDATANGGLGGWVTAYNSVAFTVTIYDGGKLTTCSKNVCKTSELTDYLGMAISGLDPTDLVPVSSPVALTSSTGNGTVRAG